MAEHTPGPWVVIDAEPLVCPHCEQVVDHTIRVVAPARCHEIGQIEEVGEETAGNAALIAAAPELLAACEAEEAVDRHWHECEECDSSEGCGCDELCRLVDVARDMRRAAIAKAGGGGDE